MDERSRRSLSGRVDETFQQGILLLLLLELQLLSPPVSNNEYLHHESACGEKGAQLVDAWPRRFHPPSSFPCGSSRCRRARLFGHYKE